MTLKRVMGQQQCVVLDSLFWNIVIFNSVLIRARLMYRHTDIYQPIWFDQSSTDVSTHRYISADMTMLPVDHIGKVPSMYIGNICS